MQAGWGRPRGLLERPAGEGFYRHERGDNGQDPGNRAGGVERGQAGVPAGPGERSKDAVSGVASSRKPARANRPNTSGACALSRSAMEASTDRSRTTMPAAVMALSIA